MKSSDLMRKFGASRQAIHRHLKNLIRDGHILKQGSSRRTAFYILNIPESRKKVWGRQRSFGKRVAARGLAEDRLFGELEDQAGLLDELSSQARANFHYAFTEMVNNAIEHSGTKYIDIKTTIDKGRASFFVVDTGVGIFENIREKKELANEIEAIQDLLKGKTTTAPKDHTGEGIFFTSKVADRFVLESHRKRLTIDNVLDDIFVEDRRFRKGTRVYFEIETKSQKDLMAIFRRYTGEDFRFEKSQVAVKLFKSADAYVSRSQAKRLLHTLDKFRQIVLDFSGVPTIGQAFADEVFRVFRRMHPEIEILPVNCNENVDFMIKRALQ